MECLNTRFSPPTLLIRNMKKVKLKKIMNSLANPKSYMYLIIWETKVPLHNDGPA